MNKLNNPNLVLASTSPRRLQIMKMLGVKFKIDHPNIIESPPSAKIRPHEYAKRLALEKVLDVKIRQASSTVIGADTLVCIGAKILCKPSSPQDAERMLLKLRGQVNEVITGIAISNGKSGEIITSSMSSYVLMRNYSDSDISSFVASGNALDKAGAYSVQDRCFHPASIVNGCYLNVVGFPACLVVELLLLTGIPIDLNYRWQPKSQCVGCKVLMMNGDREYK